MSAPAPTTVPVVGRLKRLLAVTRRAYCIVREEGGRGVAERLEYYRQRRNAARKYQAWVERYDTLTDQDRQDILTRVDGLAYKPLISVIMPVYNVDEVWLRRAVRSVGAQLYRNWELCIADDHSTRPHVRSVLHELAAQDPRIKVVFRSETGHISAASNSAIELATGDFIAFLDHDDELAEHALYLVAEELNAHPEADLIYSDEDKLDEQGRRYLPHFKPDWNPDLLCSSNYLCHLVVCRTTVATQLGGLRVGYEGAQDYDFVLRVVEHIPESHIRHIPHILYHWRSIPGSMARTTGEKNYTYEAGRKALAAHCRRRGIAATVADAPGGSFRLIHELAKEPRVSLILSDDLAEFGHALELLQRTAYDAVDVLLVTPPAASRGAGHPREHREDPRIRVIHAPGDLSPTARLNYAAGQASGEVLGFLGAVEPLSPGWLIEMVSHAVRAEIGAVGAKLYGHNGTIEHAGLVLGVRGLVGRAYHNAHPKVASFGRMIERTEAIQNYSAVPGSCLVLRREVYDRVGGFDEVNLPSAYQDVDLCLRIGERGYRILWTPFSELRCIGSRMASQREPEERRWELPQQQGYVLRRWARMLRRDPCYNPNLTLEREDFSLGPPRALRPWSREGAGVPAATPALISQPRPL